MLISTTSTGSGEMVCMVLYPEKGAGKPVRINKTGLKGFEPLTCGLRVRRYAELSYRPRLVRPNNVVDDAE